MKRSLFALLLAGMFFLPGILDAQDEKKNEDGIISMKEVVVSVTRTETTLDKIGGNSVTVITEEDIEARKQNSVEEILKTVPGIDLVSNGGPGTTTSVFMRGADSKNTLVLIDGIMFNDPSQANRGANLADLTLDNIERIEVVRGAMSVMYGSNATAGVINIITKKGKGEPSFHAGAEGGSFGTWKTYGGASGSKDKFDYSISASHLKTDGFSVSDNDNNDLPKDGNTDEKDGYKNTTLSGKFGYDITENFNLTGVVRYINSEVDLDDYGPGYAGDRFDGYPYVSNPNGDKDMRSESDQVFAKINIKNSFFDKFFISNLSYQISDLKSKLYNNDGNDDGDFDGNTDKITWQGDLNFSTNTLSFGSDYLKEAMKSKSNSIDINDVKTMSYWVQDQLFVGENLVVLAGLRLDDHDEFGSKTTYRVAPSYSIEQTGTILKASYGTGFRSPSLYELYSSYGNPNLNAEKSKGWDSGFEQKIANNKINFGATYFNMVYNNRIDFDLATWKYDQVSGDTKTDGVEAFIGWKPVAGLKFLLNYTYTDTQDPDGKRLVRRPFNKFLFNTGYCFLEKWKII
ncbi:MAG: TonB-dependent receptor [Proteobacteria bacterium]|nr:TonB-dependent receptor [Pseudomonadota bacterium]